MTQIKAYCRSCKSEQDAEWVPDIEMTGEGYYKCCECGGDDVTEDYRVCEICKQPKDDDDIHIGLIFKSKICSDCVNAAGKEFATIAEAKIFGLHSQLWRDAVNIYYEGKEI